jgi:L-ascorbate metabolism protein UlaG (beta-lactamase superfamily)
VKIRFYAHASFRLEVDGFAVTTDPYTPGPQNSGFDPIDELADVVIMSSATDPFHSDPSHVRGDPTVVNALELPPEGAEARGLHVRPFPAMESMTFDFGRDPDAMYLFTLGGVRVLHMGDIGNPISREHLDALHGKVDLLFALAGAHATIALDDLDAAIDAIGPRVVIPMHYFNARGVLDIEPVDTFLERHPADSVSWVNGSELELTPESLPAKAPRIYMLEQSR